MEGFVVKKVFTAATRTGYRRPLVGFGDAGDPAWTRLREVAEPTHLLPEELLPDAQTVVAFFLPFAEPVIRKNRKSQGTAEAWAAAYQETNQVINQTVTELAESLGDRGVRSAAQGATHNWDEKTLVSRWSHKSAAAIAGLGSFGLHRMLITDLGCAGRCGSLVIDAHIPATTREQPVRCRYFHDGGCRACVKACPVGALREARPGEPNLDKRRCYARLLAVAERFGADCCGKCAVGPCALRSAVGREGKQGAA
ncbi:MAG: epoxyqueuosine reductase [Proteobacteria bacterium]|nr:epoxyqueuosine reductase [Pseudomonadota bacterium]